MLYNLLESYEANTLARTGWSSIDIRNSWISMKNLKLSFKVWSLSNNINVSMRVPIVNNWSQWTNYDWLPTTNWYLNKQLSVVVLRHFVSISCYKFLPWVEYKFFLCFIFMYCFKSFFSGICLKETFFLYTLTSKIMLNLLSHFIKCIFKHRIVIWTTELL